METQSQTQRNISELDNVRDLFLLEKGYVNLNHGSFGTVPKCVMDRHVKLLLVQEQRPDPWFREKYRLLMSEGQQQVEEFLNAPRNSLVFVENTSAGVNACFRMTCTAPSDNIFLLDCAYPMVKQTAKALQQMGLCGEIVMAPFSIPVQSKVAFLEQTTAVLNTKPYGFFKIALFSHIISFPAVILPVTELTRICKERGVAHVVIDGAHCPGHIPLDIESYFQAGVDAYIGNCHKWLFCPKGTAIMCLNERYRIFPTVISSECNPSQILQMETKWQSPSVKNQYKNKANQTQTNVKMLCSSEKPQQENINIAVETLSVHESAKNETTTTNSDHVNPLVAAYRYTGTRDYTGMCCIQEGLAFWHQVGGVDMMKRNISVAHEAASFLVQAFGTELACPLDMIPSMVTVRLPKDDKHLAKGLYDYMLENHATSVAVQILEGHAWLRLSVPIYISMDDIQLCAERVLSFYGLE
eukprot:gene3638-6216_t